MTINIVGNDNQEIIFFWGKNKGGIGKIGLVLGNFVGNSNDLRKPGRKKIFKGSIGKRRKDLLKTGVLVFLKVKGFQKGGCLERSGGRKGIGGFRQATSKNSGGSIVRKRKSQI